MPQSVKKPRNAGNNRTERVLRLLGLLQDGHYTVRQLTEKLFPAERNSERYKSNERCVQRDIRDLLKTGTINTIRQGRTPVYGILKGHGFSEVELLILHSASRLIYHQATCRDAYYKTLIKLQDMMPSHLQAILFKSYHNLGRQRDGRESLSLEKVAQAWMLCHPLQFKYKSASRGGEMRDKVLQPYFVEINPNNLDFYVIGLDKDYEEVRTFKLARMSQIQIMTDKKYKIPRDFCPTHFFNNAWGIIGGEGQKTEELHLRFCKDVAWRIEEGGYRFNIPRKNSDGSVDVTIKAPADPKIGFPREILGWVLSFGPRVEVIGPLHLRDFWLKELRQAYEKATNLSIQEALNE